MALVIDAGNAEVTNLDFVFLAGQKNVAWFNVAVNDIVAVQVIDGEQHLDEEPLDSRFAHAEPILIAQVSLKIAFVAVVTDDVQVACLGKSVVVLVDVGVPQL